MKEAFYVLVCDVVTPFAFHSPSGITGKYVITIPGSPMNTMDIQIRCHCTQTSEKFSLPLTCQVSGKYQVNITDEHNTFEPSGIAITRSSIIVANKSTNSIHVIDRGELKTLRTIGKYGNTVDSLNKPSGLALYHDHVYVADCNNHRIQIYTVHGVFVRGFGTLGNNHGQFRFPYGVCIYNELVYVCDSGNNRIQIFNIGGKFVRTFGKRGRLDDEFHDPFDVAVANDRIFITDSSNDRIQVYTLSGEYISTIGGRGIGKGQFSSPRGICSVANRLFIADCHNDRIQVLTLDGDFIAQYAYSGIYVAASSKSLLATRESDILLLN
jgi:DNA-binding beta-propeller fold protein YncE